MWTKHWSLRYNRLMCWSLRLTARQPAVQARGQDWVHRMRGRWIKIQFVYFDNHLDVWCGGFIIDAVPYLRWDTGLWWSLPICPLGIGGALLLLLIKQSNPSFTLSAMGFMIPVHFQVQVHAQGWGYRYHDKQCIEGYYYHHSQGYW